MPFLLRRLVCAAFVCIFVNIQFVDVVSNRHRFDYNFLTPFFTKTIYLLFWFVVLPLPLFLYEWNEEKTISWHFQTFIEMKTFGWYFWFIQINWNYSDSENTKTLITQNNETQFRTVSFQLFLIFIFTKLETICNAFLQNERLSMVKFPQISVRMYVFKQLMEYNEKWNSTKLKHRKCHRSCARYVYVLRPSTHIYATEQTSHTIPSHKFVNMLCCSLY